MRDRAASPKSTPFSARTHWDTSETEWARALSIRRSSDQPFYDLTIANPSRCGFRYDEHLLAALAHPAAVAYAPIPFGLLSAREAICEYYLDHAAALQQHAASGLGAELSANQVLLTTSTSEAYSFLFRLLCDPGDEVLIAQPSYPLFDFLATLDDVKLVPYPLFYDHGWHLDLHGLRMQIGPRTRAIVVVHPNNPTGHFTTAADRLALESICAEFGLALIVDEVFLDYSRDGRARSFVTGSHPALTFVLSGLSKVAGLPQMKVSWIAAFGPSQELQAALDRLDVIADTFLSLSAPLQLALPVWLRGRSAIQQQIRERVTHNLATLDRMLEDEASVDRLEVEGGWYVTLRAPAIRTGEETALWLVAEHGIAVHPGAFFGLAGEGYFVLSLIAEEELFFAGASKLIRLLGQPASSAIATLPATRT